MGKYCFGVDVGGTTVKLGLFNTSGGKVGNPYGDRG